MIEAATIPTRSSHHSRIHVFAEKAVDSQEDLVIEIVGIGGGWLADREMISTRSEAERRMVLFIYENTNFGEVGRIFGSRAPECFDEEPRKDVDTCDPRRPATYKITKRETLDKGSVRITCKFVPDVK